MKQLEHVFFRKYPTFYCLVLLILIVCTSYRLCFCCMKLPMQTLRSLPYLDMRNIKYPSSCSLSYIGTEPCMREGSTKRTTLRILIPGAVGGCLLYDRERSDVRVMITWMFPWWYRRQMHFFYKIPSPEARANLLLFLQKHETEIFD